MVLLVLERFLKLDLDTVWFDLREGEELLIDIFICVDMWSAKIVGLADGFFHLEAVSNSQGDVLSKGRLHLSVHTLDDKVHSIELFHHHAPLSSNGLIWIDIVEHQSWSENGDVWIDGFHFLLSNPFSSQSHTRGVGISTSCRDMDHSLHMGVFGSGPCNGHWNSYVSFLELAFSLVEDLGADAVDDGVLVSDHVVNVALSSKILKLNICLVPKIGGNFDLLKVVVPDGGGALVWVDDS